MMDRALKERVIGAVVLVVFAVLLVPIFLDGGSDEPPVVEASITLPGQDDSKQKTIVLERDREHPVPVARQEERRPPEPAPAQPATGQAATNAGSAASTGGQAVAAEPKPAATPAAQASGTGMWAVQLGSFSNQENAEKLAADLRKQGYAAFLSQLQSGTQQLHRVRVGPQKDRASAEAVAARLKAAGHAGQVVPHP